MIVFIKQVYQVWVTERPAQLAAALAYYGMFSLVPIVYISLTIAGLFIDVAALSNQLVSRVQQVFGPEIVALWQDLMAELGKGLPTANSGWVIAASLISFLALFWAASGVFYQVQFAMNKIWQISFDEGRRKRTVVKTRLFSFLLVISIGVLIVLIAVASVAIAWLRELTHIDLLDPVLLTAVVLGLIWICFALMYKFVPDTKIHWKDVWLGALVAATFTALGIWLISLVLNLSALRSALAAASSFTVFIVGIYYFAQIFLLGAVVCRLYATTYGSRRV